jgi:hypothetical protein
VKAGRGGAVLRQVGTSGTISELVSLRPGLVDSTTWPWPILRQNSSYGRRAALEPGTSLHKASLSRRFVVVPFRMQLKDQPVFRYTDIPSLAVKTLALRQHLQTADNTNQTAVIYAKDCAAHSCSMNHSPHWEADSHSASYISHPVTWPQVSVPYLQQPAVAWSRRRLSCHLHRVTFSAVRVQSVALYGQLNCCFWRSVPLHIRLVPKKCSALRLWNYHSAIQQIIPAACVSGTVCRNSCVTECPSGSKISYPEWHHSSCLLYTYGLPYA